MQCFLVTVSVFLGLCLEISGEINSEYRHLYCVDPHTGVYYPLHSTWPSSTFCGTYTCSVRAVGGSAKRTKETYLEENQEKINNNPSVEDEEFEESDDGREELTNSFNHVNLSNTEETIRLYKAAKYLLNALENKVELNPKHDKSYKKSDSNLKYDYNTKKSNKINGYKKVIGLSADKLKLLFDAANGLVIQLEEKLNDNKLSKSNHRDLENLLDVTHKISDMTEKEINNKNHNSKLKTGIDADPKLLEYLDEYNKYMEEYQKYYANYLTKKSHPKTCDVIKSIVSEAKDCDVSPSEMNQMFYYLDENGSVQKIAVPKNMQNNITIPGTLVESDKDYNYWNLSILNDDVNNEAEKVVLKDLDYYQTYGRETNVKREVADSSNDESADYYNYLYGFLPSHAQQNRYTPYQQNYIQCPYNQNKNNYVSKTNSYESCKDNHLGDPNEMLSDKVLMEKFEKALAAYTEFYNYYNQKFYNITPTECPFVNSNFVEPKLEATNKDFISTSTESLILTTAGIKTTASNQIISVTSTPTSIVTTKMTTGVPEHSDTKSPTVYDTWIPHEISTVRSNIEERMIDKNKENYNELFEKLSYYAYDPFSKQYIMKTPKDDEEYQRYLQEYYEIMNKTSTEKNTKVNGQSVQEDAVAEATSVGERFDFLRINKKFPSIKEKLHIDSLKKSVKYFDSNIYSKYPTSGAEIINKPIVREKDIELKFDDHNFKEVNSESKEENFGYLKALFDDGNSPKIVTENEQIETTTEMHEFTTESYADIHPTVSYYNYDPISGKYVVKTPKDAAEYEKFLAEYKESMKHFGVSTGDNDKNEDVIKGEDVSSDSSNIKEKVMSFGEKLKIPKRVFGHDLKEFEDNFDSFVHLKYSPVSTVTIDRPIVKEDDIILNMGSIPAQFSQFSGTPNVEVDSKLDFPSFGRRMKRSSRKLGANRRNKRWEAFITVKGCPETLDPGFFKNGDKDKFYPACCPQIIN